LGGSITIQKLRLSLSLSDWFKKQTEKVREKENNAKMI